MPCLVARVKKIINVDPDTGNCSNNAAFCITVATEMFLQHLVEQSYTQVKTEHTQKPRRNIQYRDVGMFDYFGGASGLNHTLLILFQPMR